MRLVPPPLDRRTALFIDVDGTLLEIAPRPDLVTVPDGLPRLLGCLAAARGGALALVSGRPLAEIDHLFQPWCGAAAGLHGAERRRADGSLVAPGATPADAEAASALAALRPRLALLAEQVPGISLEDKRLTLALHYRAVPEMGAEICAVADRLVREAGNCLRLIVGKMVVELQPRHRGKDGAVAAFMAEPPFRGRKPIFLGDDTTDEDGFAEVNRRGGLSVRVGGSSDTSAAFALDSVAEALRWLAADCSGRGEQGRRRRVPSNG